MVVFSVAFLLRGSFDLYLTIQKPESLDLGMGKVGFAVFVIGFYFMCEVLPLFVLLMQHRKEFNGELLEL